MASTIILVLSALFAFSFVQQADAGWLPRIFCNNLKNRFLRLGCNTEQSARCNVIYSQIIFPFLGIPACDFVACNGYGNALGTCVASSECFKDNANAFCETGQVCCEVLTTTTTTTTTTVRPDGGNGGGSSDSGSNSLAADNMVDNGGDSSDDDVKGDGKYEKAKAAAADAADAAEKDSDSNESK